MTLLMHLRIVGALLLTLAALNTQFPRHFQWRRELAGVSLLTRQVFEVHSFFIILVLAMMGAVALLFPQALLERTQLGAIAAVGLTLFWLLRLLFQFFVYDAALWRGSRFRTGMHVMFSGLWMYLVTVFGLLLRHQIAS